MTFLLINTLFLKLIRIPISNQKISIPNSIYKIFQKRMEFTPNQISVKRYYEENYSFSDSNVHKSQGVSENFQQYNPSYVSSQLSPKLSKNSSIENGLVSMHGSSALEEKAYFHV